LGIENWAWVIKPRPLPKSGAIVAKLLANESFMQRHNHLL